MKSYLPPTGEELTFLKDLLPAGTLESFLAKMEKVQDFLYETNEKMNLTSLPREAFWSKHVIDSLLLAGAMDLTAFEGKICDLGCGGGFPSLVLAGAFPSLSILGVDSTGKKAAFVQRSAENAGLTNLSAIQARGNELGRKKGFQGEFSMVTARAVAAADVLVKESFGLLKKGGVLAIYRTTTQLEGEQEYLTKNEKLFSREISSSFTLPHNAGGRLFLFLRKK